MDEPFSALDPLIRRNMQEELLELQRKMRKTIIFITHDLHEALILGDRIAIMKEGRFVQVGKPQEIGAEPDDDYVAAFTQDVDRSRVFTAEWAMYDAHPLPQSDATVETALARLDELRRDFLHVVDDDGKPAGLVARADLSGQAGSKALTAVMRREFPITQDRAGLIETFGLCAHGVPVAVCDDEGRLLGALDPLDVFALLGGGDTREDGGQAAEAASAGLTAQQG
jgi:glycine betaine/proline transport system ATP-binding protein